MVTILIKEEGRGRRAPLSPIKVLFQGARRGASPGVSFPQVWSTVIRTTFGLVAAPILRALIDVAHTFFF